MRGSVTAIAQKTRQFERIDLALLKAQARLKSLSAAGADALAIRIARDHVTKLANERDAIRIELERLEGT